MSKNGNKNSEWEIVPANKIVHYLDRFTRSNFFCDCGHVNVGILSIPYAYDREENDVIFVSKCEKCGKAIFTKE